MVKVYYDEDAELADIAQETVAVIGYGIQGRAQALNLRDSGLQVVVGNRADTYRDRAKADGFEVEEVPDAAASGDIILLLIPDEAQAAVYTQYLRPALTPRKALVFAHGFAIRYGVIQPPDFVDLLLLAPRMPGKYVRDLFLEGRRGGFYPMRPRGSSARSSRRSETAPSPGSFWRSSGITTLGSATSSSQVNTPPGGLRDRGPSAFRR